MCDFSSLLSTSHTSHHTVTSPAYMWVNKHTTKAQGLGSFTCRTLGLPHTHEIIDSQRGAVEITACFYLERAREATYNQGYRDAWKLRQAEKTDPTILLQWRGTAWGAEPCPLIPLTCLPHLPSGKLTHALGLSLTFSSVFQGLADHGSQGRRVGGRDLGTQFIRSVVELHYLISNRTQS